MKVSITFDRDVKESNKKQWVKEIRSVIDKLNSKTVSSDNSTIQFPQENDVDLKSINSTQKLQSSIADEISYRKINSKKIRNLEVSEVGTHSSAMGCSSTKLILNQLLNMQSTMQKKFCQIEGKLEKISGRIDHIQDRVGGLENSQKKKQQNSKQFDEHFLKIVEKYEDIGKQGDNFVDSSFKQDKKFANIEKYLAGTCDSTYFSS